MSSSFISIKASVDAANLQAKLRTAPAEIQECMIRAMDKEIVDLVDYIVANKLQGQVLRRETGKLAASIKALPSEFSAGTVIGSLQYGGGEASYGQSFEEGGQGAYPIVPVNKKALAFFAGGGPVPRSSSVMARIVRDMGSASASRRSSGIVRFGQLGGTVVKKVMHPPIPKMPFIKPSIDENRDKINQNLKTAIAECMNRILNG